MTVVAAPSFTGNGMIRFTTVAALLAVAVSRPVLAQCIEADNTALIALDKAWGQAAYRGDRAVLEGLYADNFRSMTFSGTTDKSTAVNNAVSDAELNKVNMQPEATPDRYLISCTPLTATITHRSTFPGATGPFYTRSIHFLEKKAGKWLVVSSTSHPLNDQQQLMYMEQDWNDATMRKDTAWVGANYAPFSSDVSSRTGAIESRAQSIASSKTSKTSYDRLDLSELTTRVEGNVGVVTGINHVTGKDPQGKAFDRRVRFTDTFIKRDGRWMVWATQSTLIQ